MYTEYNKYVINRMSPLDTLSQISFLYLSSIFHLKLIASTKINNVFFYHMVPMMIRFKDALIPDINGFVEDCGSSGAIATKRPRNNQ